MLKIAYSDIFHHPLPDGHRFPMEKYSLLPEQLLREATCVNDNFFTPQKLHEKHILRTHCSKYWQKLNNLALSPTEVRRIGFPLSRGLVEREITIAQGTIENCRYALKYGVSMNIAGGTHHAFADRGEGFCLLNDTAIAAHWVLNHTSIEKILIVDLDVHQGNGTASIMKNQDSVFTFSMHGQHNFPLHKEKSDLDIPLADHTDDATYLDILKKTLPRLIDKVEPQLIFFQSGVDVLKEDKLGRLGMTIPGCRERDRIVLQSCKNDNIPLVINMGGGYSERLYDIIEAHANTFRLAQEIFF